jgi:hypothetical protein
LGWFAQYQAYTKTNLPFPDELARQTAKETNTHAIKLEQVFESLEVALKSFLKTRLENLPENHRLWVYRDLYLSNGIKG